MPQPKSTNARFDSSSGTNRRLKSESEQPSQHGLRRQEKSSEAAPLRPR